MGHWENGLIYARDFAGPHQQRVRMASHNVGDVPAATFAELLSGPVVDVHVGEARRHWTLHRNLLCHHSERIQTELLPEETRDKPENKLELPDDDPAGFELLVKWLYQGKLDDVADMADEQKYEYAVRCQKLYLLCERLGLSQLKNRAIDQYRKGLSEARLVPDAEEINQIYRAAPPLSPFRRLVTSIAARQIMDPESDHDAEAYRPCFEGNPDFAVDLVNAIRWGTGGMLFDDPTDGDVCSYHQHDNGENCHVKGKGKQGTKSDRHPSPTSFSPVRTPSPRRPSPSQQQTLYHNLPSPPLSPDSPSPPGPRKGSRTSETRPKYTSDSDDVFAGSWGSGNSATAQPPSLFSHASSDQNVNRDRPVTDSVKQTKTVTFSNEVNDKVSKPAKKEFANSTSNSKSDGVDKKASKPAKLESSNAAGNGTIKGATNGATDGTKSGTTSNGQIAPSASNKPAKAKAPAKKSAPAAMPKPAVSSQDLTVADNSKKHPPKIQRRSGSESP